MKLSRSLRLGPIRMSLYMTAQRVPIQLVGTARAWAFVGDAARPELAGDAGLADLEPPSRFGFASTTLNKIHHPLP
ncbi:MAG TPA: hypothetical protein PLO50_10925 [Nitrospira sp.]|nr:hypothetical protein [Nitrospira sp.]